MTDLPEFRPVFYYRIGIFSYFIRFLCPKMSTLYIFTKTIGRGIFIQHGFATIVSAKTIGENCWINQQVTIGYKSKDGAPIIGDNVTINVGAKVLGNIRIVNNVKIGANAVVLKDVPDNCTGVVVPAYIVIRNGVKCREIL